MGASLVGLSDSFYGEPRDWDRSPVTGIARKHWSSVADTLLHSASARPRSRPWLIHLGDTVSMNGTAVDGLEGFARVLLMAAFRASADQRAQSLPWWDAMSSGLNGGARALARHEDSAWPSLSRLGQPVVEAASIAIALWACPPLLSRLDESARTALLDWMRDACRHDVDWNNWVFFPASVSAFLESIGEGNSNTSRRLSQLVKRVDKWASRDGWFSDGFSSAYDYYNAWSFHYYLPLVALMSGSTEIRTYAQEKLTAFMPKYLRLLERTGSPVLMGRSLTYRFGLTAPIWSTGLLGIEPTDPGHARLVASSTLEWFLSKGAVEDGVLSIGWQSKAPNVAQSYTSSGSPYWAAKGFLGLLLPEDAPSWSAPEQFSSVHGQRTSVRIADRFISAVAPDGISRVYGMGFDTTSRWMATAPYEPAYRAFAYSSRTGIVTAGHTRESTVSLILDGATYLTARSAVDTISDHAIGASFDFVDPKVHRAAPHRRIARSLKWASRAWNPRVGRGHGLLVTYGCEDIRLFYLTHLPKGTVARVTGFALQSATSKAHDNSVELSSANTHVRFALLTSGAAPGVATIGPEGSLLGEPLWVPYADTDATEDGSIEVCVHNRLSDTTYTGMDSMNVSQTGRNWTISTDAWSMQVGRTKSGFRVLGTHAGLTGSSIGGGA